MLIWPLCVSTPSGGRGPRPRGRLAAPYGSRGAPAHLASRLGKAARSRSHPRLVELATPTPAARQTITLDPQNQNSSTPAVVIERASSSQTVLYGRAADSSPSERHRRADQLLFGDRSPAVRPATHPRDGGLSTRNPDPEPRRPVAEAVTSETHVEAGHAQRLTGRILPDLFGEARADARLRQELAEQAARLRAPRGARKTSLSVEPTRADTQIGDEPDAGCTTALAPIPAAEPLSLDEPVLAAREVEGSAAVEPVTALILSPLDGPPERTGSPRGGRKTRPFRVVGRGSERQRASTGLRAGEKWKRRLPRVCW